MTIKEQIIKEIDIQKNRKKERVSLAMISNQSGISYTTLSRWYNGHSNMNDNNVEKICEVLNIKFLKI